MTENDELFVKSNYSLILSDLHLCEEEPVNPEVPLWKKYKTKELFFDEEFNKLLSWAEKTAINDAATKNIEPSLELILNGDVFDFDSITALPKDPPYRVTWLEKERGLFPEEAKSSFKIRKVIEDHSVFFSSLKEFILKGHRIIIIIGNHDLELLFPRVQQDIRDALDLKEEQQKYLRFCEWFYISNSDSLIEHGHHYDPYCTSQDPIHPMIRKINRVEIRIPFGNLATRYMINGMGFFNPHSDSNYIMTLKEYIMFFFKYIARYQPLLVWTWLWGASATLIQSIADRLLPAMKDPLTVEDKVTNIAFKANATQRVVRELKELIVHPATSYPWLLAKELWLDRAIIVIIAFGLLIYMFTVVKLLFGISIFWMFVPMAILFPFFVFYSKSIVSSVHSYKEPKEKILQLSSRITRVKRIIYGHTHHPRHQWFGEIEHLNSGTWSPAFKDIECTKRTNDQTFIWLATDHTGTRKAELMKYKNNNVEKF